MFVALEITESGIMNAVGDLQSKILQRHQARPVNPDALHITLQFLGDVPGDSADRIADALGSVRFKAFDMEIRGAGAFPNTNAPRAVWVGASSSSPSGTSPASGQPPAQGGADAGQLRALAGDVHNALGPLGYRPDKPFRPHCTILRIKKRTEISRELSEMSGVLFGIQRVDEFKLKKSVLTPRGPTYEDLLVVKGVTN